jgi:hypothetical protein
MKRFALGLSMQRTRLQQAQPERKFQVQSGPHKKPPVEF